MSHHHISMSCLLPAGADVYANTMSVGNTELFQLLLNDAKQACFRSFSGAYLATVSAPKAGSGEVGRTTCIAGPSYWPLWCSTVICHWGASMSPSPSLGTGRLKWWASQGRVILLLPCPSTAAQPIICWEGTTSPLSSSSSGSGVG